MRLLGKVRKAVPQLQLCVAISFDYAARVLGIEPQVALDRLCPDDSILSLVSVLGRFKK